MEEADRVIRARCPWFACCVCRTKTSWPHQLWCDTAPVSRPACEDYRYFGPSKFKCLHPAWGKGDGFVYGKA